MHYSRGYHWLAAVQPGRRTFYTLLTNAVIVLLWFVCWYMPMSKALVHLECEMQKINKDTAVCSEQQESCKKLSEDLEQTRCSLAKFSDVKAAFPAHITSLVQHTNDADIQLLSIRLVEQKDRQWYTSVHATLDALGSLAAIQTFFKALHEKQQLVQCDELSLQKHVDDTYVLHCVLKCMLPKEIDCEEIKSPSTLKKAEGLGG
jgi:Tfp pilus assembly protein PilO